MEMTPFANHHIKPHTVAANLLTLNKKINLLSCTSKDYPYSYLFC